MKNFFRSPACALMIVCVLLLPIIALTSPAAVQATTEYSSALITRDISTVDYQLKTGFDIELQANYGEYDTDGNGEIDFKGIAVDMYVKNISDELAYGISGVDAILCFDNTLLEPLYKTSDELNGKVGSANPTPISSFPTYTVRYPAIGLSLDWFSVEGLCKAYAHTDGSYNNPQNPNQIFTGPDSYISCNYVINTQTHVAWLKNKIGLLNSDNVSFRYYFKLIDESGVGGEFTFTVPDSPDAQNIAQARLKAPYFLGEGHPHRFANISGRGDSITLKLWNNEYTAPETTVPETTVPETTVPETTVPETTVPETTVPETTVPETTVPETTVPETTVPETTVPETTVPETTVPETTVPETTVPETTIPETTVPETTVPETTVPETTVPETTVPETTVPETTVPETTVSETTVPETTVPETTVPETTVPETTVPETTVPETTVPETTAPETTVPETTVPETTVPETTVPDVTTPSTTAPSPETTVTGEDNSSHTALIVALVAIFIVLVAVFIYTSRKEKKKA